MKIGSNTVNELGHEGEWKRKVTGSGEHSKPFLLKELNFGTSASEETRHNEHYSSDENHG